MIMKKCKFFLVVSLFFILISNLFAGVDKTAQIIEKKDNSAACSDLKKNISREYKITGQFAKDSKYNKKEKFVDYVVVDNSIDNKINNSVYHKPLNETRDLLFREDSKVFDITGREVSGYSRKLVFTKYQKAQIQYLEMEKKSKISTLDKEISSRKKSLIEELAKDMHDVFVVDALSKEIKELTIDKETVSINVDKKLRYILDSEQFLKYKEQQNKKNKKK